MDSGGAQELIFKYRYPILVVLIGVSLIGLGVFIFKGGWLSETKIEVLPAATETDTDRHPSILVVEVSGAVVKPGVYELEVGKRVEDALILAGGLSGVADREWVQKYVNSAARLNDGVKIYIPKKGESSTDSTGRGGNTSSVGGLVDINTATLKELDGLPGIGQVYGQRIIEQRPYSSKEELLSKGVLKRAIYEKIKDKIRVY